MLKKQKLNDDGVVHLGVIVLVIFVIAVVGFAGYRVVVSNGSQKGSSSQSSGNLVWQFDGSNWKPTEKAPDCKSPMIFDNAPTDLTKATSVLYPGQTRGGNYKPHGGFRFDNSKYDEITVRAIMDGDVISASRYIESGEVQHLFMIENDCGIAYRYDHLAVLSADFQRIADTLPEPKPDDSRGTNFEKPYRVKAGDTIATAVGFKTNNNVGFDLGVYDYRQKNQAAQDPSFVAAHKDDLPQSAYAVCWFDWFSGQDSAIIKDLPPSDFKMGKTSDYCK